MQLSSVVLLLFDSNSTFGDDLLFAIGKGNHQLSQYHVGGIGRGFVGRCVPVPGVA